MRTLALAATAPLMLLLAACTLGQDTAPESTLTFSAAQEAHEAAAQQIRDELTRTGAVTTWVMLRSPSIFGCRPGVDEVDGPIGTSWGGIATWTGAVEDPAAVQAFDTKAAALAASFGLDNAALIASGDGANLWEYSDGNPKSPTTLNITTGPTKVVIGGRIGCYRP